MGYRDGRCKMTLLDRYDIINKAILCEPSFDARSMEWFQNSIGRLRVVADHKWETGSSGISLETKVIFARRAPVTAQRAESCISLDLQSESGDSWTRPQSP